MPSSDYGTVNPPLLDCAAFGADSGTLLVSSFLGLGLV